MSVFLPVEIHAREFDSRVLLASAITAHGRSAVVGNDVQLLRRLPHMLSDQPGPASIFLNSIPHDRDGFGLQFLRNLGLTVVVQDDEAGLTYGDYEDFFRTRYSLRDAPLVDAFIAWGDLDYEFFSQRFPCMQPRLYSFGSPRSALWSSTGRIRYREEIAELQDNLGPYVLVVSSLGTANSFLGKGAALPVLNRYGNRSNLKDWSFVQSAIAASFRDLLYVLQKTENNIIVRPHPTENPWMWRSLCRRLPRTTVVSGGSVTPLVLGSQAVIHGGSLTALEASFSGIPTFAVPGLRSTLGSQWTGELERTLLASVEFNTDEELIGALAQEPSLEPNVERNRNTDPELVNFVGTLDGVQKLAALLASSALRRETRTKGGGVNLVRQCNSLAYEALRTTALWNFYPNSSRRSRARMSRYKKPRLSTSAIRMNAAKCSYILGVPAPVVEVIAPGVWSFYPR